MRNDSLICVLYTDSKVCYDVKFPRVFSQQNENVFFVSFRLESPLA